jgi:hypothetical protein
MPKSLELARPMMTGGAGFNSNEARRKLLEEREYIAALELAANDHLSLRVDTMHLKNRLRDIETTCRNRMHL